MEEKQRTHKGRTKQQKPIFKVFTGQDLMRISGHAWRSSIYQLFFSYKNNVGNSAPLKEQIHQSEAEVDHQQPNTLMSPQN